MFKMGSKLEETSQQYSTSSMAFIQGQDEDGEPNYEPYRSPMIGVH